MSTLAISARPMTTAWRFTMVCASLVALDQLLLVRCTLLVSAARLCKFDRVSLLRQLQHDRRRLLELVAKASGPIAHHVLIGVIFPAFAHLDVECQLVREATRRNQRSSETIRGHQRGSSLDVERYRLLRRLMTNHHVARVVRDLAVLVILGRAVGCGHQV